MAGGCNFPEVPAAEGGKKRYYRGIYAATLQEGTKLNWKQVGLLPAPAAYGVSLTTDDGIICIGGNNEKESLCSVLKIKLINGKAVLENLPSLPVPMDNFTGSIREGRIDVYAGNEWFSLNLTALNEGWQKKESFPSRRVQPVSGYCGEKFCVWGGFSPKSVDQEAILHLDGIRMGKKTARIKAPVVAGDKVFLGGAASVYLPEKGTVVIGGVNKDIFLNALNHPTEDYMLHPAEWYRFNPHMLLFRKGRWHLLGTSEHAARAGATLATCRNEIYIIGGELKPGIRVPMVSRVAFDTPSSLAKEKQSNNNK